MFVQVKSQRRMVFATLAFVLSLFIGLLPGLVQAQSPCGSSYTPIYQIQGSGMTAAITGNVTTQGVVVGDFEGTASNYLRGFFLQDPTGDGNPATSDGVFVFDGSANAVSVGQLVRVTGTASEYGGQTQISTSASSITICGTDTVAPVDVTLPFPSADFPERYEGMLVRLPQTLYVTEHYQLGRYGQVTMSVNGRQKQPTNVAAPGAPAAAIQAANNLGRIFVDDATNIQNPDPIVFGRGGNPLSASNTLRGGDTATGIVGIMNYYASAYRVRPVNALGGSVPNFAAANPRPTAPSNVGGTLKVASMNLLNYFNTFDGVSSNPPWACNMGIGGALTDCRGADSAAEFNRQWPKTVAAILAVNPDVLAVNEIENDGYGPTSAVQDLVTKLNNATTPGTFAFIDADARTGQTNALGTDAIKVGMIYKPAKVNPLGTAVLNNVAFVNGGDSVPRSRPSLAQAFQQISNGERLVVDANHFKSKSGSCDVPDAGDGQGSCNVVRTNAANALVAWLATDPTGVGDADVLIIGDLNSYAMEDPVTAIKTGGYTNLVDKFVGADAYSYVFDGQWGYLDVALGSASMTKQVTGVTEYHINADEPSVLDYNINYKSAGQLTSLYSVDQYRVSDHDPVIVGLNLDTVPPTLTVSVSPNELWPADHKYVTVKATVKATDNTDPNPKVTLVSVASSEPDNGLGDGDQSNDIVKVNDYTFNLRAERSATGPGRVYTITYKATDAYGNSSTASVKVTVPHDKGNVK